MKENKIIKIILILCAAVFLFGSGFKLGQYSKLKYESYLSSSIFTNRDQENLNAKKRKVDLALFWETWDKLAEKFIDKKKLDSQKMLYSAIKGMVSSLDDPYTFFLSPKENKEAKKDLGGLFEGIGAQLGLKENRIIIIAPLKNSPAEKVGARAGDFINKVDGRSTRGWTLPQAVAKIRGPQGTKVRLTLERDGKEFEIVITRAQIKVSSVELNYETKKDKTLAYLKIIQFGDNTNDEWDKAVNEIVSKWQKKQILGLIIDVRDNPGGYLESSVYTASEFLPFSRLIVKQESTTSQNRSYRVSRLGRLLNIPLAVLINQGSASASEILAGTLRDHRRARLVGVKTFGKGSVQEAVDLKDGAGLHVTVAKWILPNGDWINNKGIKPDIVVENKIDGKNTLTRENDRQLEKAVEILLQ